MEAFLPIQGARLAPQLKWKLQHMEESVPGWQDEAELGRTQPGQDSTTSQNSALSPLHPGDTGWLGKPARVWPRQLRAGLTMMEEGRGV